jgi:hypothetical protein
LPLLKRRITNPIYIFIDTLTSRFYWFSNRLLSIFFLFLLNFLSFLNTFCYVIIFLCSLNFAPKFNLSCSLFLNYLFQTFLKQHGIIFPKSNSSPLPYFRFANQVRDITNWCSTLITCINFLSIFINFFFMFLSK